MYVVYVVYLRELQRKYKKTMKDNFLSDFTKLSVFALHICPNTLYVTYFRNE